MYKPQFFTACLLSHAWVPHVVQFDVMIQHMRSSLVDWHFMLGLGRRMKMMWWRERQRAGTGRCNACTPRGNRTHISENYLIKEEEMIEQLTNNMSVHRKLLANNETEGKKLHNQQWYKVMRKKYLDVILHPKSVCTYCRLETRFNKEEGNISSTGSNLWTDEMTM